MIKPHQLLILLLWTGPSFSEVRLTPIEPPVDHRYTGEWEHFVGGGVSSFDCNDDGFADLYVAGGSSPARLLVNQTETAGSTISFSEQTPKNLSLTEVSGSYSIDIDSDNKLDLVVLRVGNNHLFRGRGNCEFEEFPIDLNFQSGDHWTTAFSASWEADALLPTLAFGNYVDRKNPDGPFEACDANFLYRPVEEQYSTPVALTPGFCSLSLLFSDWGRLGRMDLRISNDRHYYVRNGSEQLWAMESEPRLYGPEDGWQDFSIWGMGIASRDISGDGLPEIFLTSMGDQKLQSLQDESEGPNYRDATYDKGTTAHRPFIGDDGRPSTGWHAEFADFDNDGRDDIFIAKGNVEQMLSSAQLDPNNLLMQTAEGNFVESALEAGVASMASSRGAALTDFNLDGLIDLVVINRKTSLEIYQNTSDNAGNWLLLSLHQEGLNSLALGAWVEINTGTYTWHREITVGGGHAGSNTGLLHFGLGKAESISLRVRWPDGAVSDWVDLETNQRLRLQRSGRDLTVGQLLLHR